MAAIYQWFTPEDLEILTTTLYPIEVFEKIQFGASLVFGSMVAVPLEAYSFGVIALGGNITPVLVTTPLHDEAYDFIVHPLGGNIAKILLTTPTEDDAYSFGVIPLGGNITESLVKVHMPDEGVGFGCALISGSMTHI
jgi:hypothetical protein